LQSFGKHFDRFYGSICHSNMRYSVCKVHKKITFFPLLFSRWQTWVKILLAVSVHCGVTFVYVSQYESRTPTRGKKRNSSNDSSGVWRTEENRVKRWFSYHSPTPSSVAHRPTAIIPDVYIHRILRVYIYIYIYIRTREVLDVRWRRGMAWTGREREPKGAMRFILDH